MKKTRFMSKAICLSSLGLLAASAIPAASCSSKNIDELFFTVKGKDLEVTFCDRGASIYSMKYKDQYITYHPKDKNTFLRDDFYYGKTLGRVAGRIKDGKLSVGGKDYQLEVNETAGKKNNSLHGGTHSFASKDFKRNVQETDEFYKVSFEYVSPALEAGYPEEVDSIYVYTIYKNKNVMDLNITATSTGVTPVNLTNHPYFRLGNDGDVQDHLLTVPANEMAKYDNIAQDQTVIGLKSVENTPWDFRTAKRIGQDIKEAKEMDEVSGGYDHIWKFAGKSMDQRYVELTNPKTKLSLKVNTDADAVIMYANCYPHENMEMNPSGVDALYGAITVEPYTYFDKDSISRVFISPDKPFNRNISYEIKETE